MIGEKSELRERKERKRSEGEGSAKVNPMQFD
jgi:hypothetical protein